MARSHTIVLIWPSRIRLSCEESHRVFGKHFNLINPRLSLAARIGWLSGLLSVFLSLLAGIYVGTLSQTTIEREIGALYADRAQHIADAIDLELQANVSTMQVGASVLGAMNHNDSAVTNRGLINLIKRNTDDAVWIGVTDVSGVVLAGQGGLLEGSNISGHDWFRSTLRGLSVTGPQEFPELESSLKENASQLDRRFVFVTAPIMGDGGAIAGFSVACFDMKWVDAIERLAGESLVDTRPVDIFMLGQDGKVLNQMLDGVAPPESDLSDRIGTAMKSVGPGRVLGSLTTDNYLVGFAKSRGYADFNGTDWTIVIREAKQTAYAPANQTSLAIGFSCLALGVALSLAAALGTRFVLGGLQKIAASADSLRLGQSEEFVAIEGKDEVARISRSLANLFTGLKDSNSQLADLNRDLDRKVSERTREVQRLSEETKNVAITRERLRMSRDLHDTLAHSMLAMLTQLRMMQKIYKSKPELIEEELGYAERAAQEGLDIAREAVVNLRYFAVRDDGLGAALSKLVRHLKERVEIDAILDIQDSVSSLAGPLAETTYRIAEEALRNVEKHANASRVSISARLDQSDPASHILTLVVEDDGRGFDQPSLVAGHFGIVGMRELAEIIGGELRVESQLGRGTSVHLEATM